MFRTLTLAFTALAILTATAPAATCDGVDLAITSVHVKGMSTTGKLNDYTIVGTMQNLGTRAQLGGTIQSVYISQYSIKLDSKGIPPLAPGQSYTFTYVWPRSTDAGKNTSTLDFRLYMQPPVPAGQEECNTANDHYSLTL